MVDTWQPNTDIDSISATELDNYAQLITSPESAKDDIKRLSQADIDLIASYINAPEEAWLQGIESFPSDKILKLCILFTLGEMAFSSWAFGSKNPTIYFLRYLKKQKHPVEKDFVRWLKKHTDNRYIPYGPAL